MTPRQSKRKRPTGKVKAGVLRSLKAQAPTTRQVRAQIKRLENWINGLEMIPATQIYRSKVILPLFSKALTVGWAICVLVDEGFPAEAFGLSRTLVDMFFCVRYMSNKDTDARMTTYVEYWARVHQEWGNIDGLGTAAKRSSWRSKKIRARSMSRVSRSRVSLITT